MKNLLVLFLLIPIFSFSQTINISLDYAGLIVEPVQGETTPVTDLEIGDEFYIDVVINNTDNSVYQVTYADIWFTFKNDAFQYLGVENPLDGQSNWYTNQWPSTYIFHNSTTAAVDDLYGQATTNHYWEYVPDTDSDDAPLVITSQTSVELSEVVARLKFKYKPVPNGFDFTNSVILRKARVRDNVNGYDFTDIKAFPNQTFDNVPTSTRLTAILHIDFPQSLDPTKFSGGLHRKNTNDVWELVPFASTQNFDSAGDLDITQGFNRDDELSVIINYTDSFSTLYDEIVTISDASSAFEELHNRGINGDESGNVFSSPIQFMNSDVNQDGNFDTDDTFGLLAQVLQTTSYLEDSTAMVYASKLYNKDVYDGITIDNYSQKPNGGTLMLFLDNSDLSTLNYEYYGSITWRGDVNLSHSSVQTPQQNVNASVSKFYEPQSLSISSNRTLKTVSTSLVTELVDGKVIATISLDTKGINVVGTQYKVSFDTSKLELSDVNFKTISTSTNFSNLKDEYVNIGSLVQIQDKYLDNNTKYVLTFTPKVQLQNTLGLVILSNTDAVSTKGEQLKMEIE